MTMTQEQFERLPKYAQAYITEIGRAEWKTWGENIDLKKKAKALHSTEEARAKIRARNTNGEISQQTHLLSAETWATEDATVAQVSLGFQSGTGTAKRLPGEVVDLSIGEDLALGRAFLELGFRLIAVAESEWSE